MKIRTERPPTAKLSAACAAIDAAASLYTVDDLEEPSSPPPEPGASHEQAEAEAKAKAIASDELSRLAELEARVESATAAFVGDAHKPGAPAAAAAISACARRAIGEQREILARAVEMPPPPTRASPAPNAAAAAPRRALDRAVKNALERYFSHFEMPETQWYFRWQLKSGAAQLPEAYGSARSPSGIAADFSLPVPVGAPWRSPTRVGALASINGAKLLTGLKPMTLSKLWLVAMTTGPGGGQMMLARSRKKPPEVRVDLILGQGAMATPLDAEGNVAGHAVAQAGETVAAIAKIAEASSQAIREMIEDRGSIGRLTFEGVEVEQVAKPSRMAAAMMAAMQRTIAELRHQYADDPRMLAALENRLEGVPEAGAEPAAAHSRAPAPPPGVPPIARRAAADPGRRIARGTNSPPIAALEAHSEDIDPFFSQETIDDFDVDVAWSDTPKRERTLPGV